jgi:chorismate dehydratase
MSLRRIGAVGYLNTRPLVRGLDGDPRFAVRFDVPAMCATLLHEGAVDVAMIPSIEFLRGGYRVVPGVAIASMGEAASVAVFSRRPICDIRSIALDSSSRTSVALLRILCAERFGIAPAFVPHAPDLETMLRECDAALLIGDPALFADADGRGLTVIDLGAEWTAHTGLPFVWAFWAGRAEHLDPATCRRLQDARDLGVASVDAIAGEYAGGDLAREARARHYLRHNMRYDLGVPHEQALRRFYRAAVAVGVVTQARDPEFAPAGDPVPASPRG